MFSNSYFLKLLISYYTPQYETSSNFFYPTHFYFNAKNVVCRCLNRFGRVRNIGIPYSNFFNTFFAIGHIVFMEILQNSIKKSIVLFNNFICFTYISSPANGMISNS